MKLLVVGLGQCGGRIADEFARLEIRAQKERDIGIVTGAFAVNTDIADLAGLTTIKPDYQHRILIGAQRTAGHGVGKVNELGAEIAREDSDKIIDAVRMAEGFTDTDAFLLVAGAAGGTGSGSLPTVTQFIKERCADKPVFNLVVLPFQHEEAEARTVYNVATCLKSSYLVADAVFLVDNQRYISKDSSVRSNLAKINAYVVNPFFDLLCAGEEKNPQYVASKILDAGDILQTLQGWTVIGYGESSQPRATGFLHRKAHFREKMTETHRGLQAMTKAIGELSLRCNPADACRALYVLSGPAEELYMHLFKELSGYVKSIAPQASIRAGDYPRQKGALHITVILSELRNVKKATSYFSRAIEFISGLKRRQEGIGEEDTADAFRDIPTLL